MSAAIERFERLERATVVSHGQAPVTLSPIEQTSSWTEVYSVSTFALIDEGIFQKRYHASRINPTAGSVINYFGRNL